MPAVQLLRHGGVFTYFWQYSTPPRDVQEEQHFSSKLILMFAFLSETHYCEHSSDRQLVEFG